MTATKPTSINAPGAEQALLAAFKDPAWQLILNRSSTDQRCALTTLKARLQQQTHSLLTEDEWGLVKRINPDALTQAEGRTALADLDNDLQRENRREIVSELRAAAVSTADVDALRSQVMDWDALMAQPEQVALIEGVLTEGAVAALIGPMHIGKSFLALDWCLCVATGTPWLGKPVSQRPVLYLHGEGGDGLIKRLTAWAEHKGVKPTPDQFRALSTGGVDEARAMRTHARMAAEGGFGLVVLDTLSSLAPEAEKPERAPAWMGELKRLREGLPGRGTVMFVHHTTGSDSQRARNSTALEANADEVFVLSSVQLESPLLTLKGKKIKDGPNGWTIPMRRTPLGPSVVITSQGGASASLPSPVPGLGAEMASHPVVIEAVSWADRIRNHLAAVAEAGATPGELVEALTVEETKRSSLNKALKVLCDDGEVVKVGRRYYFSKYAPAEAA
jgi:hypothetical protein